MHYSNNSCSDGVAFFSSKNKHVVHFNVKAGDVIVWKFATKKRDIAFGKYIIYLYHVAHVVTVVFVSMCRSAV